MAIVPVAPENITVLPSLRELAQDFLDRPYEVGDCWKLVYDFLQEGGFTHVDDHPLKAAEAFTEVWCQGSSLDPLPLVEPWDLLLLREAGQGPAATHVAVALDGHDLLHVRRGPGVCIEPLRRWRPRLINLGRLRCLTTGPLALETIPVAPVPALSPDEAVFSLALSPLRSPEGALRLHRTAIPAGQTVAAALPPGDYARVIWNGTVLDEAQRQEVWLQPGDEITAFPQWGFFIVPLIPYIVAAVVISVAATALQYLLFPPSKPHVEGPDPRTFTFQGIQTAVGPGAIKPIVYGRHRFGGQLLSAAVDHVSSVVDTGFGVQRVYALANPPTLTMLIALGEGPVNNILLNTVEINGQPVANFPGTQFFTRLGTADQTPIPEFNETRNTYADGRQLPDNSSNTDQQIIYTTHEVVDAFV